MVFVTGGTGLVGAHLLYKLAKGEKQVLALKRASSDVFATQKIFAYYADQPEVLFKKIKWVDGDILDYFSLEKLLKGVDTIFHCAAIVSFDARQRQQMIGNNVEGTANLVNAALENNVRKFCHVSSIASLGRNTEGYPVTEETKWVPSKKNSGYSESKFFSETEVWRGIEEGLDAVIVNPSIILGPGNWGQGSPKLFKTIDNGLKVYTKGVTGYVDVRDVVKAMLLLTEDQLFEQCKGERFLLSAEDWSYQDFFNAIANALGKKPPRYFANDFVLGLAWRAAYLWQLLSGKPPLVSKDSVANANATYAFDGSKIKSFAQGFEYRDIAQTIQEVSGFLKNEKAQNP